MPANRILDNMLDRLFAAMVSGPNLNCRPHASRQRIDLAVLSKLQDLAPGEILTSLLGADGRVRVKVRVAAPVNITYIRTQVTFICETMAPSSAESCRMHNIRAS